MVTEFEIIIYSCIYRPIGRPYFLGNINYLAENVGLDSQTRSRSGLCSKPPDLRSVCDIALTLSITTTLTI